MRLHPFELAFGDLQETKLAEIRAAGEAASRDRRLFLQLAPVQALLDQLAPPEDTPVRAAVIEEFGTLLYAAFRFWTCGTLTVEVGFDAVARAADAAQARREPVVPGGACYLRFPERLLWSRISGDAPHEPLDGLFVVSGQDEAEITVVAVLGLRLDRPGFSQIAVTAPTGDFARAGALRRHPLFAPVMDGGDRAGFHSVVTEGELLDLTHLALIVAAG